MGVARFRLTAVEGLQRKVLKAHGSSQAGMRLEVRIEDEQAG